MKRLTTWIAVGFAVAIVAIVAAVSIVNWGSVQNTGISLNGWIALILGALATLAVGIGLMTLAFISSRRGYDDQPGKDR